MIGSGTHRRFAAVSAREVLDDGETEAGAAEGARARAVNAVEALEDSLNVFGRDAFAIELPSLVIGNK